MTNEYTLSVAWDYLCSLLDGLQNEITSHHNTDGAAMLQEIEDACIRAMEQFADQGNLKPETELHELLGL